MDILWAGNLLNPSIANIHKKRHTKMEKNFYYLVDDEEKYYSIVSLRTNPTFHEPTSRKGAIVYAEEDIHLALHYFRRVGINLKTENVNRYVIR
jgi:hypothetical protein